MLEAKLVIIGGAKLAQEYPLSLPATIGRGDDNDIPLAHPLVSRRHCELFEEGDRLFVRDLGSTNGSFIGNQPVEGVARLEPGQLLTIGTVTLRAIYAGFDMDAQDGADVFDDDELADELADEFAGGPDEITPPDRAGLTMTGSGTNVAARRLDANATETNAGLETDTTAPSLVETDRLPAHATGRRRKRKSR